MDTLSISPAKATTPQQPTASAGSKPTDKAVEKAKVAVQAQELKKADAAAAEAKSEAPERDSRSVQYLVQGNRVITTIVDDQSKKVVVQIPDAELIRIAKSIDRMQGFFIEQNA